MTSEDGPWPRDKLIEEEDRRVLYLQGLVDSAILRILHNRMTRSQALELVNRVRSLATELFPDSMSTFDLIYLKRFQRVIEEYTTDETE